MLKASDDDLK